MIRLIDFMSDESIKTRNKSEILNTNLNKLQIVLYTQLNITWCDQLNIKLNITLCIQLNNKLYIKLNIILYNK